MRRLSVTSAAVIAAMLTAAGLAAQNVPVMTINDLLLAVRVGDPQLSPDGRNVLYVRTSTEARADGVAYRRNADIRMAPTSRGTGASAFPGFAAVELIGGPSSENSPRWFPDGKSIAFISSRDGEPQVFVAD